MRYKLEEIAEFQKGFAFKSKDFKDSGVRIVKVSNLTSESIDSSSCVCIDNDLAEKYIQYELIKDDIIITTVGSWPTNPASVVGKVVKVPENMNNSLLNQNAVRIRGNSLVNQRYLYYLLKSNNFRDYIIGTAQGSANQASITQKDIKNFKYDIPTLKEQEAISKILSDLDEKIETNIEINKKLEEMAQAIFKQWFVDFEFPNEDGKPYKSSGGEMVESELGMIPKGWEVVKLQDIGNLTMGLSPKSESYNAIGEGIPLLNGAADFYGGLIKATKYTTKETRVCKKNDLVFCIRATIGNITFADKEYCLGRGVASIESKKNLYIGIIYMNLSRSIERLKAQATGSVILGLSKPDINDMKLILPTKEILNKYSDIFKNAFDKKHILELENDKLINLRDILLPKLMSGEIRVPLV